MTSEEKIEEADSRPRGAWGAEPLQEIRPVGIRDTRLIEKAIKKRWPIKDEHKLGLVSRMERIVADPDSSPREVTSAFNSLLSAESQNQADEHKYHTPADQLNVEGTLLRPGDDMVEMNATVPRIEDEDDIDVH